MVQRENHNRQAAVFILPNFHIHSSQSKLIWPQQPVACSSVCGAGPSSCLSCSFYCWGESDQGDVPVHATAKHFFCFMEKAQLRVQAPEHTIKQIKCSHCFHLPYSGVDPGSGSGVSICPGRLFHFRCRLLFLFLYKSQSPSSAAVTTWLVFIGKLFFFVT